MSFLKTVSQSVYGPDFYRNLRERTLGDAFRFYMSVAGALSLVWALFIGIGIMPTLTSLFSDEALSRIAGAYPPDLVLTVEGGIASSNAKEPYIVPLAKLEEKFPQAFPGGVLPPAAPKNFIVIDTKDPFSIEQFRNFDTAVLVTKDALANAGERGGRINVEDMSRFPNITINRENVGRWIDTVRPFLKFAAPAFTLLAFLGELALFALDLGYLLLLALLVLLIFKIKKLPGGYKDAYKAALFLATLPSIIQILIGKILGANSVVPALFTLVFIAAALVNLRGEKTPAQGTQGNGAAA